MMRSIWVALVLLQAAQVVPAGGGGENGQGSLADGEAALGTFVSIDPGADTATLSAGLESLEIVGGNDLACLGMGELASRWLARARKTAAVALLEDALAYCEDAGLTFPFIASAVARHPDLCDDLLPKLADVSIRTSAAEYDARLGRAQIDGKCGAGYILSEDTNWLVESHLKQSSTNLPREYIQAMIFAEIASRMHDPDRTVNWLMEATRVLMHEGCATPGVIQGCCETLDPELGIDISVRRLVQRLDVTRGMDGCRPPRSSTSGRWPWGC